MPVILAEKAKKIHDIDLGRFRLPISERTLVMGVLNATPDSFSDAGLFTDKDAAIRHALKMAEDGADIIDVGGESTRPGSRPVSISEELNRTIPLIKELTRILDIPISIDTSKSEVAKAALENGACIVNDITGLKKDPGMAAVPARYKAAVIVMHMKGMPETMQLDPTYEDLIAEITDSLKDSVNIAQAGGVDPDKIIIDPGIGFGKTLKHNLKIINGLGRFEILGKPIAIGLSRKSFIGAVLNLDVSERLMGSAACHALAIAKGADIIRVHDVKEASQVARMADAVVRSK